MSAELPHLQEEDVIVVFRLGSTARARLKWKDTTREMIREAIRLAELDLIKKED